jgi:RNA polymerase sigma-70 factor, ECF subfamily
MQVCAKKTPQSVWLRTRVSLIGRLQSDVVDDASWTEFYEIYWRAIYGYALGFGMSSAEADDIVQEVFVKLFRQLPSFQYNRSKGRFLSWIKTVTRNTTYDALRRKQVRAEGQPRLTASEDGPDPLERLADPESLESDQRWDREWEQSVLLLGLERVREKVEESTYMAFVLYAIDSLPPADVAKQLNISINAVYVAKNRMLKHLKDEVQQIRKESGEYE